MFVEWITNFPGPLPSQILQMILELVCIMGIQCIVMVLLMLSITIITQIYSNAFTYMVLLYI